MRLWFACDMALYTSMFLIFLIWFDVGLSNRFDWKRKWFGTLRNVWSELNSHAIGAVVMSLRKLWIGHYTRSWGIFWLCFDLCPSGRNGGRESNGRDALGSYRSTSIADACVCRLQRYSMQIALLPCAFHSYWSNWLSTLVVRVIINRYPPLQEERLDLVTHKNAASDLFERSIVGNNASIGTWVIDYDFY